jgi:tetratricopeptide (TPR) repeat protein
MKTGKQAANEHTEKRADKLSVSIPLLLLLACLLFISYRPKSEIQARKIGTPVAFSVDPLALVLTPQTGDSRTDKEISRLQQQIRDGRNPELALEQLGWNFVAKARESFDAGFYKLAEQCARCLEKRNPQSQEAMLLRGHVLHNLHRFKAAEPLARELVAKRGLAADFGLLGDVLMEQGGLKEAADAYQRMLDLKPSLHSYSRAAHMRWLKGDLTGAIEAMRLAVASGSPQDAESTAWVNTRLASYQFQAGDKDAARRTDDIALSYQHDYAPALLLRGRIDLSEGEAADAIVQLRSATRLNPLPEYQWALAEALRDAGRDSEALNVEQLLTQTGATNDPRTYALYLATRGQLPEMAVQLAQNELKERADVFTHDALAWSLAAAGRLDEALPHLEQALAEGTRDARLFLHAAVILAKAGHKGEAASYYDQTRHLRQLLLPSERQQLQLLGDAIDNDLAMNTSLGDAHLHSTEPAADRRERINK